MTIGKAHEDKPDTKASAIAFVCGFALFAVVSRSVG
jgi:hypothetical protein